MSLLLETTWGDLVIDLDIDGSPELCKNILKLAKVRFYTNTLIFSVTPNRFCQAGDPVGDGTGGSSIYGLTDEDSPTNYLTSKRRFVRSVGRSLLPLECRQKGRVVATNTHRQTPDTIGSQFLITTADGPDRALDGYSSTYSSVSGSASSSLVTGGESTSLNARFLSLGLVAEDADGVLDRINAAYTDPNGRPYADIRIVRAIVLHDPFPDVAGMDQLLLRKGVIVDDSVSRRVLQSPSPERPLEETVPKRISALEVNVGDNDIDSEDDEARTLKTRIEAEEAAKLQDKSRAVVLEMLGDLPDADITAPEDVLFICKLNPITVDEDLELIFSRFDERVKVEIIRDADTAASLQYAFAEFTTKQAAVEAYFKMNNALVDDRRIKVDFSQSVAKLWNKYRQELRMPTLDSSAKKHRPHDRQEPRYSNGHGGSIQQEDPRRQHTHSRNQPHQQPRQQHQGNGHRPPPRHHQPSKLDDFGRSRDFQSAPPGSSHVRRDEKGEIHNTTATSQRRAADNDIDGTAGTRREERHVRTRDEDSARHDRSYENDSGRSDSRSRKERKRKRRRDDDHKRRRRDRSDTESSDSGRCDGRDRRKDERRHKRHSYSSDEDDRKQRKRERKHGRDRDKDHKRSRHR